MRAYLILFFQIIILQVNAQDLAGELSSKYDEIVDSRARIDSLNSWASSIAKSDPSKSQIISEYILALAEEESYTSALGKAHYNIGRINQYGPFDVAMEHLLVAKDLFLELSDDEGYANTLLSLALVHEGMGSIDEAVNAATTSIKIAKRIGNKKILSRGHTNLTAIYHYFDKLDSALYHGKIALQLKREIGDRYGTKLMLLNMGVIMANYDSLLNEGLAYLLEARKLAESAVEINDVEANLIYAYSRLKQYDLAEIYLDSALIGNDTIDSDYTLRGIYNIAVEMYQNRGDYEKAYQYLKKEYDLDKALRGTEVKEKIEVLQLENENNKKAKQILTLEKEKAETNQKYLIAGILFLFASMGGVIIFLVMRVRVKNEMLRAKALQIEVEHKNRELAAYAVNFVQKNEIINTMKEKVQELDKKILPENRRALKEISGIIDESFRADKEWENFKLRFEEVHEGFFVKLAEKYPDLGSAEVKLCALIRLNMSVKEASQILGIAPDSVKTSRYRIRKKLGLTRDENLMNFLATVTT